MPLWSLVTLIESDTDQVLAIETRSFERSWHRSSFLYEFSRSDSHSYGVRVENSPETAPIVAYICYRIFGNEMHLLKIAVLPEWRLRGIGAWLLAECMREEKANGAYRILLEVRPSNRSAVAMYGKMGFSLIGKRRKYYPDTREDALVLAMALKEDT